MHLLLNLTQSATEGEFIDENTKHIIGGCWLLPTNFSRQHLWREKEREMDVNAETNAANEI